MFTETGKLIVNGTLNMIGNDYTETDTTADDSTIHVFCSNNDVNGYIQLNGAGSDSLVPCKFKHLQSGLKISKGSSGDTYIDHCEFSYNTEEGICASGGDKITIKNSTIFENGADGAYVYNCKAVIDSTIFHRNNKNALYLYSVSSASTIQHCEFNINGGESTHANVLFNNCSPKMEKCVVSLGGNYGLYGINGAYPILWNATTAANTIEDNANHETYWASSYPDIAFGHNNFNTEDDTIIYINATLETFNAKSNYWGGGPPDTGSTAESISYYGPGTFLFSPYDETEQFRIDNGIEDIVFEDSKADPENQIDDNEDDARDVFLRAVLMESDSPAEAMRAYRQIIASYGAASVAPIAIERLLWLTRGHYRNVERMNRLDLLDNYFAAIADTSRNHNLAWKAHRAALWALAAQHRYDEAIAGFEAIVQDADCLADSVFAVIDVGTLHLEAEEWAERNDPDRGDAVFGSLHELCPVNYPEHRTHTDELLALLNSADAFTPKPNIPDEFFLAQNYPNPFNSTTRINYGLSEDVHVMIKIYDVLGREVITLVNEPMKAGYYTSIWFGRSGYDVPVSSGLYFYRIQAGRFVKTQKMTVLK